MGDCHIGSWREPKLRDISTKAFAKAVDICIDKNMDFVLISGDLFDTALPGIERLKSVVKKLKELNNKDIPVYVIAGSHDYSPSGKTMLDVLEHAGLFVNVCKLEEDKLNFTVDKKTGAKITGMYGKRGALEKSSYEKLNKTNLEQEPGFKIFMFHTALTELKPKGFEKMDSMSLALLPKNFDYYAAGHLHSRIEKEHGKGKIIYPGALFPNNFKELEENNRGGFYIYDNGAIRFEPVQILNTFNIKINCNGKTPKQVEEEISAITKNKEFINTIVTLRLTGTLEQGKTSDIAFKEIFENLYSKSAFFVMKNTSKLVSKEFEETAVEESSVEDIEETIIKEHLGQVNIGLDKNREEELIKRLLTVLDKEKQEGEKKIDFEKRVIEELVKVLDISIK